MRVCGRRVRGLRRRRAGGALRRGWRLGARACTLARVARRRNRRHGSRRRRNRRHARPQIPRDRAPRQRRALALGRVRGGGGRNAAVAGVVGVDGRLRRRGVRAPAAWRPDARRAAARAEPLARVRQEGLLPARGRARGLRAAAPPLVCCVLQLAEVGRRRDRRRWRAPARSPSRRRVRGALGARRRPHARRAAPGEFARCVCRSSRWRAGTRGGCRCAAPSPTPSSPTSSGATAAATRCCARARRGGRLLRPGGRRAPHDARRRRRVRAARRARGRCDARRCRRRLARRDRRLRKGLGDVAGAAAPRQRRWRGRWRRRRRRRRRWTTTTTTSRRLRASPGRR